MKTILFLLLFAVSTTGHSQTKTIHVFVALCDNEHQGIVPVPKRIGNGKDPARNLYWGAGYGVKNFFDRKTKDWQLVTKLNSDNPVILERYLFKHSKQDVYLLAEAYDGERIKDCVEDFLKSSNGQSPISVKHANKTISFGGKANLLCYVGHNGLMDFPVDIAYSEKPKQTRDVMILACYSKSYFTDDISTAGANPILWTTHLMAPEAYTLKSAIDGWLKNESKEQIEERAAQTYHKYQKCGIRGARNLFTSGF